MKRLGDLTAEDLAANPVWRYEEGSGADAVVVPVKRRTLSQADDEIFLAATEFELFDATRHGGFCFPADDSGIDYLQPVIVTPSGHVSFWFDAPASPEVLAKQWGLLGKPQAEIFPVGFRCLVPVDGRTVCGHIDGAASSSDLGAPAPASPIQDISVVAEALAPEPKFVLAPDRVPTARPVKPRREPGERGKRTARRRKTEMKVEFSQGDFRGTGVVHDVSPRGMFVRSPHIPGTGPMLRLTVNLPEGRTLVLKGRVVRGATSISSPSTPHGFGLRLDEHSPEYEDLLSRLRDKRK